MPNLRSVFTNMSAPMPLRRRLYLVFRNDLHQDPKAAIEEARAKAPLKPGDWGCPPENPLDGWVRAKKPDRSWGAGEFRYTVRDEVLMVIHPEGEGSKAESLFWGKMKTGQRCRGHPGAPGC